jgi:hypothetical protein
MNYQSAEDAAVPAGKPSLSLPTRRIGLTPVQAEQHLVSVSIAEMIAYSQESDFTRLNLIGGKVLNVKETTDQIDRLVRVAAASQYPLATKAAVSSSV